MNLGLIQKAFLALAWKQAQKKLDAAPMLPTSDAIALADSLDSRTVTGAAWAIVFDIVAVAWRVLTGEITLDEAFLHVAVLVFAVLFCYCRHAISKHKVEMQGVVDRLRANGVLDIPDRSKNGVQSVASKVVTLLVLAFSLSLAPANAADDTVTEPSVTINTNTVNSIVASVLVGTNGTPTSVFESLPELVRFAGVMSITEAGVASGGAAMMVRLLEVKTSALTFEIGPAYVAGLDADNNLFQAVEIGVVTAFPASAQIQEKFSTLLENVPVLKLLPKMVNVSGMQVFGGIGATVDGTSDWTPTGFCGSVGVSGIKLGK